MTVDRITEAVVVTKSGREVEADAIVLTIDFATQQMLCVVGLVSRNEVSIHKYPSYYPICGKSWANLYHSGISPPKKLPKPSSILSYLLSLSRQHVRTTCM
jgi:hypothetical protein